MQYDMYTLNIERELMQQAQSEDITTTLTRCVETEGSVYKCHYYEVKLMDGEREVYKHNHGNLDRSFNEHDRLRKYLLIGRCHA